MELTRGVDAGEWAEKIGAEKHFQVSKSVRTRVHEPDPGENHRGLQDQTQVQLPTEKFAPALLPDSEGDYGQRRHHPGDGALAKKTQPQGGVHQKVAAPPVAGALRIKAPVSPHHLDP